VGNVFDRLDTVVAEQAASSAQTAAAAEAIENAVEQVPGHKTDEQTISRQPEERVFNYFDYIGFVWILGVFLVFAVKVLQYRSFIYCVRTGSNIVKNEEMSDLFRQVEDGLGIKKGVPLYQSRLIKSPMLIGLIKPVVVIPESFLGLDSLNYVFKHELIHYKRFDIWYKWLVQLAVCIHWFNPLVHIMSRRINSLCEFSCDEAVSGGLDATGKKEYCSTIISAVSLGNTCRDNIISVTLCEEKQNLKERLGAILKYGKKSRGIVILSGILIVALCCTAIFLGAVSTGVYREKPLKESTVGSIPDGSPAYPSGEKEDITKIVMIDPGHGGNDAGLVYNDPNDGNNIEINEKEQNLKTALLLRDMLEESGVNVQLTRQEDNKVTLEDRMESAKASNASLFVSIHLNGSSDRTKKGTLTMYNSSDNAPVYGITGQKAAQLLQAGIADKLGTEDAGVTAMSESLKYDKLEMPAVIVELAFMTNTADRERVMAEGFELEAAKALHEGIISVLNGM